MIGISSKIAYTIEIQTYIFWNLLAGVWEQIHLTMNELISGCEKGKGHLQMLGLPANTMWCRDDKCVRFPLSVGRSGMQLADIHKTLQWKKGKKKNLHFYTCWTLLWWSSSANRVLIKCTAEVWKICFSYLQLYLYKWWNHTKGRKASVKYSASAAFQNNNWLF